MNGEEEESDQNVDISVINLKIQETLSVNICLFLGPNEC